MILYNITTKTDLALAKHGLEWQTHSGNIATGHFDGYQLFRPGYHFVCYQRFMQLVQ